jgi:hypothetical protein
MGWIHFWLLWFLGWHKLVSGLKQPTDITQSKAEADKWIYDYEDLYEYMALKKYSVSPNFFYPALYCVW